MRFSLRALVSLVLALALPAAAACERGGGGEPTTAVPPVASAEAAVEPGPFAVGVTTVELVDTTRPTSANNEFEGSDQRELTVEIWYPAAVEAPGDEPARDAVLDDAAAPYPLIVFAHGLASSRLQSSDYTRHLASHGYVVASPDFPLSGSGAPGGPRLLDVINQPGDVSFLIDSMLAFSEEPGHRFEGAVDGERIGMTGHSLGGFTTLFSVYGFGRDERIRAALPLSASGCQLGAAAVGDVSVPVMLMTGSDDLIVAPPGNRYAYEIVNPPRYWVELIGGNHVRFASIDVEDSVVSAAADRLIGREPREIDPDAEPSDDPCEAQPRPTGVETISLERQQELLRLFATPFFDAYLRDSADALAFLHDDLPELVDGAALYEFDAE